MTLNDFCKEYNISYQTAYRRMKKYKIDLNAMKGKNHQLTPVGINIIKSVNGISTSKEYRAELEMENENLRAEKRKVEAQLRNVEKLLSDEKAATHRMLVEIEDAKNTNWFKRLFNRKKAV